MNLLLALFFISGTCGLVYEVLWVRLVGLGFGSTVAAVSTVLAAFMAGLGAGAFYFGRLLDRRKTGGLLLYAWIEAGIGLSALLLSVVLFHLDGFQIILSQRLGHLPLLASAVKAISVFALLSIPTFLMGGTLPVVTFFAAGHFGRFGDRLAALYAVNTFGAAGACLAADYLLIPRLGVLQAAGAAALVNLLVALGAWRLNRRRLEFLKSSAREKTVTEREYTSRNGAFTSRSFCLPAAAICGFAGLGVEVVWTRLLLFYTGSRIQAFSLMLATYLCFLALGSILAGLALDEGTDTPGKKSLQTWLTGLFWVWGAGIIFSILPMAGADRLFHFVSGGASPKYSVLPAGLAVCAATMAVPCLALGASFPLLGRLYLERREKTGRAVGNTYLANTAGGILGALVAGFILLPGLGTQKSLLILGGLGVVAGYVFFFFKGRAGLGWIPAGLAFALFAAGHFIPGDWVLRHVVFLSRPADNVLLVNEGVNETVVVTEEKAFGRTLSRTLWTNGFSMSGSDVQAQRYMRLLGHLPALLAERPGRALLVCYGVGNTLSSLTAHPGFEQIDVVEISPQIIEADTFFRPFNEGALSDPRVRLHIGDGRNFLLRTDRRYAVITSEPPPPTHAGVVNLYSREYYELCREHLAEGGLVCQWLPVNQMPYREGQSLVRAFLEVFPQGSLWYGSGADLLLLGGEKPLKLDLREITSRLGPKVSLDLEAIGVQDVYQLLSLLNAGPARLRALAEAVPPTTDNHPYIEYPRQPQEPEKALALCRMHENPESYLVSGGADSAGTAARLDSAAADAQALREYAVALDKTPDGGLYFRNRIPFEAPLLERMPENRYLLYLLGVDVSLVAAAFRVAENPDRAPAEALRVLGKHFFYHRDAGRARQCFDELARRKVLDPEVRAYLTSLEANGGSGTGNLSP